MFTLGHNFAPANIHAGGLRYHGAGVFVSQLLKAHLMEAVDIQQLESFEAGCLFARVVNLSGHGLIDMASYDKYLACDLVNYSLTDEDIQKNLDEINNLDK